jgi:Aspartyl protease
VNLGTAAKKRSLSARRRRRGNVFALLFFFCAPAIACAQGASQATSHRASQGSALDTAIKEFRIGALQATLAKMPPGPEHDYAAGVLANRAGNIEESIRLLERAIPQIRKTQPRRAAIALECLADDFTKIYRYADAAKAFDDLLAHFAREVAPADLQNDRDNSGVVHLLKAAPPQTISLDGPVRLKTQRDPTGDLDTDLRVNGVSGHWLLDTGANMSVVTVSFAKRIGVNALPGYGQTSSGITGIENRLQVAVLPELKFGSATVHNVVLLILADKNLNVGTAKGNHQIDAVLGYPVLQALGALTFSEDGTLEAGHSAAPEDAGARMFMDGLTPMIECGVNGKNLLFDLDTGANGSMLSVRYFKGFKAQSGSWKKAKHEGSGAGGVKVTEVYLVPTLELKVGDQIATLHSIPIFTSAIGTDLDDVYGNLGQDMLAGFDSFTLDFAHMRFSLGRPVPGVAKH